MIAMSFHWSPGRLPRQREPKLLQENRMQWGLTGGLYLSAALLRCARLLLLEPCPAALPSGLAEHC